MMMKMRRMRKEDDDNHRDIDSESSLCDSDVTRHEFFDTSVFRVYIVLYCSSCTYTGIDVCRFPQNLALNPRQVKNLACKGTTEFLTVIDYIPKTLEIEVSYNNLSTWLHSLFMNLYTSDLISPYSFHIIHCLYYIIRQLRRTTHSYHQPRNLLIIFSA